MLEIFILKLFKYSLSTEKNWFLFLLLETRRSKGKGKGKVNATTMNKQFTTHMNFHTIEQEKKKTLLFNTVKKHGLFFLQYICHVLNQRHFAIQFCFKQDTTKKN